MGNLNSSLKRGLRPNLPPRPRCWRAEPSDASSSAPPIRPKQVTLSEVKKARVGVPDGESLEQGLLLPWTSLVNVMPFLLGQLGNLRLVSKAHRQAVDGYLLFDKGRVPLNPPLGFRTTKYLKAYDIYVLATYGEEAWKAGWTDSYSAEFVKLSRTVRKDLQRVCDALNQRNTVELNVKELPAMPVDFSPQPPRHLTALDVYVLRRYGVKFWTEKNRLHQIYFGELEDEYNHLCSRAKYHLQHEARAINQRFSITEFTEPPVPDDFTPPRHVDSYDVFVIRKYGVPHWQASCAASTHATCHREDFRRLCSAIKESLKEEAKAINCRLPPTPMPPPLPPTFKTDKQLGSLDIYVIRKIGEAAWRSKNHNWVTERSEYCLLSDHDRWTLRKEAEDLNRRIELTPQDLASMHGITNEGAVYTLDPSKRSKRCGASSDGMAVC